MLILEIAAGIVLGVLVIAVLPALLRVAQFLIGALIVLVAVGALAIFAAVASPEVLGACLIFAGIAAAIGLFGWWSHNYMLGSSSPRKGSLQKDKGEFKLKPMPEVR